MHRRATHLFIVLAILVTGNVAENAALAASGPATPKNVRVARVAPNGATIRWGRSSRALSYRVQRSRPGQSRWTTVAKTTALRFDAKGLVPETDYRFRVIAARRTRRSPPSASVPVQTLPAGSMPPPIGGYFELRPVGAWDSLPTGNECASRVHSSTWEPRPENAIPNSTVPNAAAVRASLAARPRSGGHDERWDSWLLPRVDGAFTGTTDEIFQWGACKWGVPDDMLRAIAASESTWYQYLTRPDGSCVETRGCGDVVTDPLYCVPLTLSGGYDYQKDYGLGRCPGTFGIMGVKSHHPWDPYLASQNGTFPYNRDSTAFAVDYQAAFLRGCYEGWVNWLRDYPGAGSSEAYGAGDMWGCVGTWYAGEWHTSPAESYISANKDRMARSVWLDPSWMGQHYEL